MDRARIMVLVVEDEALMAMLLCRGLSLLGYQVCDPAAMGSDAIRLAQAKQPDVVLMDIRLAGELDGIETAERILSLCGAAIVFMTGYSDASVIERAQALNPAAYLVKPLTPADIAPVIDGLFDDREP